ncbi:VolA/Pla-1 family phospholipase [Paraferrimonas sedimenticola]|uniref:Lipase n=1 Tax=Paraferrimonas sedimenticola TaxID=375674 RepID=A0AA37W0F8_9GAMM|nr:VolA/Pla-1 family phospholipase [Paraferrimonas sedimenticola]GLP94917.1 lipase [Paraferrimonas sedimenticola]
MKRLVLASTITALLGVAGCSEDSFNETVDKTEPLTPVARVVFDPAAAELPVPNDLLFNGTTDGTLNMPGEQGLLPGEMPDYSDPETAIGALDGWSVMAPMVIEVAMPQNSLGETLTLDAGSVSTPGGIRVFEAVVGGALSTDPECTDKLSVSACKIGAELQFGVDFAAQAISDNQIAIIPLKAYKEGSSYVVAVTTGVQDSEGRGIAGSSTYELLKLDIETQPLETDDQLFLQGLVNSYEKGIAAAHGVDTSTVVYSGLFTTQSAHIQIETLKGLMAMPITDENKQFAVYKPSLTAPVPVFVGPDTQLTAAMVLGLDPAMQMDPALAPIYLAADASHVYSATLTVPYFLQLPSPENCVPAECTGANSRWMAAGHSPIAVLGALQAGVLSQESYGAQAVAQGIDPAAALEDPSKLVGAKFFIDYPDSMNIPVDAQSHVTKFNPVPAPQGFNAMNGELPAYQMDVFITMPNTTKLEAFMEPLGLEAPVKPAEGWPTTMVLHGITGFKEGAAALAGAYSVAGQAVIAIDMPLHGSRSIDLNGDINEEGGKYEISASEALIGVDPRFDNADTTVYMNLANLLTGRDNLRQSVVDHLGLRFAITQLSGMQAALGQSPDFNAGAVALQGLSLGGIVGSGVSAYAATGIPGADFNPYGLTASSLVAPGQGIGYFLVESPSFGPRIQAILLSDPSVQAIIEGINPACVGLAPGDDPVCDVVLGQVYAGITPSFSLAAQTVIDSGDPVMYSPLLAATKAPVQLIEVVGDGANNPGDLVIPNSIMASPMGGTEPMIAALGLPAVSETVMGDGGPVSGAIRFLKGHHSSLLDPNPVGEPPATIPETPELASRVTAEMQTQVATYAASKGQVLQVTDAELVKAN